jgi:hypothetical protein
MNIDASFIAILVAAAVGVALLAGAFAGSLIIEATKSDADTGQR